MYDFLVSLHSTIRWILVLVLVLACIKLAIGWIQGSEWNVLDQRIVVGFTGIVDLNVALGLVLLLWQGIGNGLWEGVRLEHGITMILALTLTHATARWRRESPADQKHRNNFIVVIAVGALVAFGVWRIGGWS